MYTRETEIRLITSVDMLQLVHVLDLNNSWKKLMQIIPKDCHSNSPEDTVLKYSYDHMRLVENASIKQNRMATEILFDEWGTSGKKRPTLGVLLELLVRAELFRAACMVAVDFLNEEPPVRPSKGPAAAIDLTIPLDSEFINDVEDMLNDGDSNFPGTETLNDNAKPASLADNNIDFYEKYHANRKHIDIPPPPNNDSNNLSRPSTDNGAVTPEPPSEQTRSNLMKFSQEESEVIPILSELTPSTVISDANIPMLSALNTQQSSGEILPNISALNVEDVEPNDDKLKVPEEATSMLSSSSVSSLSSTADEDDLSAPNLSILDQRSSNNDSSLTNVTGTSEENSFEMSINEGSASNDNIPCLSALK